jgi:hypothetical protein
MKQIPLSKGRALALVDDDDFDWLMDAGPWQFACGRYGRRFEQQDGKRTVVWMHRAILKPPRDRQVDHIDGNGLNNKRANLRVATMRQNLYNRPTQREAGVFPYWDGQDKWRAQIWHEGKKVSVGVFLAKGDARDAYEFCAYHLRGEFSVHTPPPDFDVSKLGPSMRARIEALRDGTEEKR